MRIADEVAVLAEFEDRVAAVLYRGDGRGAFEQASELLGKQGEFKRASRLVQESGQSCIECGRPLDSDSGRCRLGQCGQ